MRKRIKRGMALLAALLLVLTTAPAPVYGAVVVAGNQTGDIGKESWISRKEFYGSFSSFGTIHAGSLSHLSVRGSDDKCITAFCLDAGKRFSSGKTIRCSGSVASQYPVIAEELNGLVAFYLHNQIFPEDLRRPVASGRLLIVSLFSDRIKRSDSSTAETRNRFILEHSTHHVFGSVDPNGHLARLIPALPIDSVECL